MCNLPEYEDLDVSIFQKILDLKNLTQSYKIYWVWAIIELCIEERKEFSFKELTEMMFVLSWVPVVNNRLNFSKNDQLEIFLNNINNGGNQKRNIDSDKIRSIIQKEMKNSNYERVLCRYVPYRTLSPFYKSDLNGLSDGVKNQLIEKLSNNRRKLYSINSKKNTISIDPKWYKYFVINKGILQSWIAHKLIIFLQSRNPNVPGIIYKVTNSGERNLTKQRKVWKTFLNRNIVRDYFDGGFLDDDFELDHFIPWSYFHHNCMWNLLPIGKINNIKKSDSLLDWDEYSTKVTDVQYRFYSWLNEQDKYNEYKEEYILFLNYDENEPLTKLNFQKKYCDNLYPQYLIAKNLGY